MCQEEKRFKNNKYLPIYLYVFLFFLVAAKPFLESCSCNSDFICQDEVYQNKNPRCTSRLRELSWNRSLTQSLTSLPRPWSVLLQRPITGFCFLNGHFNVHVRAKTFCKIHWNPICFVISLWVRRPLPAPCLRAEFTTSAAGCHQSRIADVVATLLFQC